MAPNRSEFAETIHGSREAVWDALFTRYGEIHVHNPNMQASHYMNGATVGELGCERHCDFTDKLWLDEKIAAFVENESVTVVSTRHNLPFLKDMSATYELVPLGAGKTEVKMTSFSSTSPWFMIYLMRGTLGKSLIKHLFGMKYYVETGETITLDDYDEVHRTYKEVGTSLAGHTA